MDPQELECHAIGERRLNYLNQIKCILDQMDDVPCSPACMAGRKPLLEYPGYINRRNPDFSKKTFGNPKAAQPMKEYHTISRTEQYPPFYEAEKLVPCSREATQCPVGQSHKNMEVTMKLNVPMPVANRQADHGPPQYPPQYPPQQYAEEERREALGGEYIGGCECTKHNGMQDQCRRVECKGNPACLTDPPSCLPARMMPQPKMININDKYDAIFRARLSEQDRNRLC